MTASSGLTGFCEVCGHHNNEHNRYTCSVKGCSKKWKICQSTAHQLGYVVCAKCGHHPHNGPDGSQDYTVLEGCEVAV
jgi:hypothetical protein